MDLGIRIDWKMTKLPARYKASILFTYRLPRCEEPGCLLGLSSLKRRALLPVSIPLSTSLLYVLFDSDELNRKCRVFGRSDVDNG